MPAIEDLKRQLDRWNFAAYPNGPNSEAEIAAVEATAGHDLPEDFRWFCLTHGDGHTKGNELSIELDNDAIVEFDRLGNAHNLRYGNDTYQPPTYPPGVVPCATTVMGDVFFLRLDPTHNGSVWYWGCYEGKDPIHGLVKAADSFTDLLASSDQNFALSDRLTLRSFERKDSAALFTICSSPETMRLMPRGLLQDEAAAATLIDERRSLQLEVGHSMWAVVLRPSGQLIGTCGFKRSEPGGPFELGYLIDHNHWGQGYATEAAAAAIEYVFDELCPPDVVSTVFATIRPDNHPSIAVAGRLGMHQVDSTSDEHGELLKFELHSQ